MAHFILEGVAIATLIVGRWVLVPLSIVFGSGGRSFVAHCRVEFEVFKPTFRAGIHRVGLFKIVQLNVTFKN